MSFVVNDIFSDENTLFESSKVTISVFARNGKKYTTTVIGMAEDLDLPKILSHIKKTFNCNGSIIKNEKYGEVMSFTGNQKENIYNFLIKEEIYNKEDIIVIGA